MRSLPFGKAGIAEQLDKPCLPAIFDNDTKNRSAFICHFE